MRPAKSAAVNPWRKLNEREISVRCLNFNLLLIGVFHLWVNLIVIKVALDAVLLLLVLDLAVHIVGTDVTG